MRSSLPPLMRARFSRRGFLGLSAAAAVLPGSLPRSAAPQPVRGRKLKLGVVGVANRGGDNLNGVKGEDIVGLCDVDARYLDGAHKQFPAAKTFRDWRDLLKVDGLDGVVVSTPDHLHALVTAASLRRGLHVYCEKPLAHSIHEVRAVTELARERGLITKMGTQIHALPNYRRVVELVRAGVIGKIQEVDVWCGTGAWGGVPSPAGADKVPDWFDWDLWLGPAPERPFVNDAYHPANWRRFWDFGGGNLADMGCHYIDLVFWALGLHAPETVEAKGPALDGDVAPKGLSVTWTFPAANDRPSVTLTWHDAGLKPAIAKDLGVDGWGSAVLFRGSEGFIVSDYNKHEIGPKARFEGFKAPEPSIPDSIGHHEEWCAAIRGEGRPTCEFGYSGPLSECVLLGNVSFRLGGKKLIWEPERLRVRNAPEAAGFLQRAYRDGWSL